MVKRLLIAANWKMNPPPEGSLLPASPYLEHAAVDVIVLPGHLDLERCIAARLITGGQYGHPEPKGAHTGDVSIQMLARLGCRYVLCGHSERRRDHHESSAFVMEQVVAALEANIHPILCVGETLEEREAGKEHEVVKHQLKGLPEHGEITIAYEPVWAIGTGKTATPQQAQAMHAFIRPLLPKDLHAATRILYGGSMNKDNAEALLLRPDIDGGLIGGVAQA